MKRKNYFKFSIAIALFAFTTIMASQNTYAQKNRIPEYQKRQIKFRKFEDDEHLNGHYFSLGSSVLSCGYYGGLAGFSYEFRYHIVGVNFSVGAGYHFFEDKFKNKTPYYPNVNAGVKLYMSNTVTFIRNLYFNLIPICYFGQFNSNTSSITIRDNSLWLIEEMKQSHLYGIGLFLGYAPVWHLNKIISLGINIDIGIKTNYKFEKNPHKFPFNWDLGIILKFDHHKKSNTDRDIYNKNKNSTKCWNN